MGPTRAYRCSRSGVFGTNPLSVGPRPPPAPEHSALGGRRLQQPGKRVVPRGLSPCLSCSCRLNCRGKRLVPKERWGSLFFILPFLCDSGWRHVTWHGPPQAGARRGPCLPPGGACGIGKPGSCSCCPPCSSCTLTRVLRPSPARREPRCRAAVPCPP